MSQPVLKSPTLVIVLEQNDELVEYTVQTDNRDSVAWDMHRNRVNWPAGPDAPMLWMTYLAWSAMRRDSSTPAAGVPFDAFNELVRSIEAAKKGEPEPADPTHAGPAPA